MKDDAVSNHTGSREVRNSAATGESLSPSPGALNSAGNPVPNKCTDREYRLVLGTLLLYSLVADDIRLLLPWGKSSDVDVGFDVSLVFCGCIFLLDVALRSMVLPMYIFGLSFLTDLLSGVFLFLECLSLSSESVLTSSYSHPSSRFAYWTSGTSSMNHFLYILVILGRGCRITRLVSIVRSSSIFSYMEQKWVERKKRMENLRKRLRSVNSPSGASKSPTSRILSTGTRDKFSKQSKMFASRRFSNFFEDNMESVTASNSLLLQRRSTAVIGGDSGELGETSTAPTSSHTTDIGKRIKQGYVVRVGWIVSVTVVVSFLLFGSTSSCSSLEGEFCDSATVGESANSAFFVDSVSAGYFQWSLYGPTYRPNYESVLASSVNRIGSLGWVGVWSDGNDSANLFPLTIPEIIASVESVYARAFLSVEWSLQGCVSDFDLAVLTRDNAATLAMVSVNSDISRSQECPLVHRRSVELSMVTSKSSGDSSGKSFLFVVDNRSAVESYALMDLVLMLFMFLATFFGSWVAIGCVGRLVLAPIARMKQTIIKIQHDPITAGANILLENGMEETNSIISPLVSEISAIEASLLRTSALLLLGFGDAGAKLVKRVLTSDRKITDSILFNDLSILKSDFFATNIRAVFGFIGIRNFNELTAVLGERMVVLVNQVAEIVHGIVDEYGGFVSSNTGDGFMLVWKLAMDGSSLSTSTAELAVTAVCQIVCAVERSPVLQLYRDHPSLRHRNYLSEYKISVGAALHCGSAVEGIIGSADFKIDPTYVGPDVALARTLERLAQDTYFSKTILSGPLVELLSDEFKNRLCRRIDCVAFEAGRVDTADTLLFTIDLATTTGNEQPMTMESEKSLLSPSRQKISRKINKLLIDNYSCVVAFSRHELGRARSKFESNQGLMFNELFKKGLLNYLAGEWDTAKTALLQTLVYWQTHATREERRTDVGQRVTVVSEVNPTRPGIDGPSYAILMHMEKIRSQKKIVWKGHRLL